MICEDCQKIELSKHNKSGVCRPCYVKRVLAKKKKPPLKCKVCGVEISCRRKSLLCKICYDKDYWSKEENIIRKRKTTEKWNEENKGRRRKISLSWQKNNPERAKAIRFRTQSGPQNKYTRAKYRAGKRGFEWTLSREEYLILTKKNCCYCNGKLEPCGVGLDRKDNKKGYTIDNVVSCCGACNKVKSDVLTYEEMKAAMNAVLSIRSNNGTFK